MDDLEVQGPKFTWRYDPSASSNTKFPFTTRTNRPANQCSSLYNYHELLKRVSASMDYYCRDVGNVVPWIVQDLNSPNAGQERDLLPKLYGEYKGHLKKHPLNNGAKQVIRSDYVHAYYGISGSCKAMLTEKVERAQRQHAHDLAIGNKIDVKITWYCEPSSVSGGSAGFKAVLASKEDADNMETASDTRYGTLDWDKQHYKEPELPAEKKESSPSKQPSPIIPTPDPDYRGGFYTVVTHDVYQHLLLMASEWGLTITQVLEPKRMTDAELAEMKAYHNFRHLPKIQYEREVHFRTHGTYPETAEERDRRILRERKENLEKRLSAKRRGMFRKNEEPSSAAMWDMLFAE